MRYLEKGIAAVGDGFFWLNLRLQISTFALLKPFLFLAIIFIVSYTIVKKRRR